MWLEAGGRELLASSPRPTRLPQVSLLLGAWDSGPTSSHTDASWKRMEAESLGHWYFEVPLPELQGDSSGAAARGARRPCCLAKRYRKRCASGGTPRFQGFLTVGVSLHKAFQFKILSRYGKLDRFGCRWPPLGLALPTEGQNLSRRKRQVDNRGVRAAVRAGLIVQIMHSCNNIVTHEATWGVIDASER